MSAVDILKATQQGTALVQCKRRLGVLYGGAQVYTLPPPGKYD